MFEQDYVMRIIKEMIRAILKLVFRIDATENNLMETNVTEGFENNKSKHVLEILLNRVDAGNINDAENQVYELTQEKKMDSLKIALLFYYYLNDKTDEFLEENNFSREEVKAGLEYVVKQYGLTGMIGIFLAE